MARPGVRVADAKKIVTGLIIFCNIIDIQECSVVLNQPDCFLTLSKEAGIKIIY